MRGAGSGSGGLIGKESVTAGSGSFSEVEEVETLTEEESDIR
jgi:hypothetical protein